MKTIWKVVVLSCVLVVAGIVFTSCNDDDKPKGVPEISVNLKHLSNDWRAAMALYAQSGILEHQLLPYYLTSAKNNEEQAEQLQMVINSGVRVIVLSPEPGLKLEEVNAAIKRRIPVILFEEALDVDYTALVQGDNVGAGRNAGVYVADKQVGSVAVFAVAQDPASSNQRVTAFKQAFRENSPATSVIDWEVEKYSYNEGKERTLALLKEYPEIEAIYAQDDEIAMGVYDALKATGEHQVKVIVGCGGAQTYLEYIEHVRDVDLATTLYSPAMISKCIDIAADLLEGKQPEEKRIVMPATLINKENVGQNKKYAY
ncbi:ribose transport system substrate-binding protein [Parabacteroides sp. PFB2-10]|uniref:substrate-binding domain-containing protein n=1 Tax=Parabacteroides sp. PFB2-10 TaxID=1742405 RepID=UPI00247301AA|nr:substrate-binding domain-containing protein [Parabacteroides sp. PFB2-10]MDH6311422.1 ribose transport system substrate-binding protein [Parabacteroides sp. PFB2-10]